MMMIFESNNWGKGRLAHIQVDYIWSRLPGNRAEGGVMVMEMVVVVMVMRILVIVQ